ncbi:hypothetical protein OAH36_04140 [Verrucomicrobia bacterium]|jgi:hypothetical protein|nr:hypothetical protein [Verrucomicrobiota bacterium]
MSNSQKRTLGCFAYGCITVVILAVVGIVAVSYWAKNAFDGLVDTYTDAAPLELPMVEFADAELVELKERVGVFRKAVDENESEARLELSADELNALIIHDSQFEDLKGKVYLDIKDKQLVGEISLPLEELDIPFGEGRYLNGYGVFDVSIGRRGLEVFVKALEVSGKSLPEEFMGGLTGKNLIADAKFDDEAEALIDRLKTLEIMDDRILLEIAPEIVAEVSEPSELEVE